MTQETDNKKRVSILRIVFRVVFWPVRRWRNAAITLITLFILNFVAVQMLLSKLAEQREAAHARGEATSLSDFQLNDLRDDKNAAIVYRYAQSLFRMPDGADFDKRNIWKRYISSKTYETPPASAKDRGEEMPSGPLTPEEEGMVDTYVTSNTRAYDALLEASAKPACQFGDYNNALTLVSDPQSFMHKLDSVRSLARSIALRAVWEARHGNTDVAYEWIDRGLHLANDLRNDPLLIHGLLRIAVGEIALNSLATVMCETPWSGKLPDGFEQELVQILDRHLFVRCLEGERCFGDACKTPFDMGPRIIEIPMRLTLDKVLSDVIVAVRESDAKKRNALIAEVEQKYAPKETLSSSDIKAITVSSAEMKRSPLKAAFSIFRYHNILAQLTAPALLRATEAFDRLEARAQNARQAIVLKRYKQEHGQYPDQLQQILSETFKELPLDPYNGEPFHYRKEGDGFLLYSVGANRVDDGGQVPQSARDGDVVWRVTQ